MGMVFWTWLWGCYNTPARNPDSQAGRNDSWAGAAAAAGADWYLASRKITTQVIPGLPMADIPIAYLSRMGYCW